MRKIRRTIVTVMTLTLSLLLGLLLVACGGGSGASGSSQGASTAQIPEGEDIVIQIADLSETARFYPTSVDGVPLEVLALKAPDGSIRTAFNTCQVCYDSGRGYYVQEGDALVCQNCGNRFSAAQVEVESGGCNPVPIFSEYKIVDDSTITIPAELLQQAKVIFENWKNAG
jgi:uncharacterized membrane protein